MRGKLTKRSRESIEREHLRRLGRIASSDHERFFQGRPEYRDRVLAVALAQGAAQHFVDVQEGKKQPNGVRDFDVWTFFVAIPGQRFPADKRETHADFGPSVFGRQRYDYEEVTEYMRHRFRRWEGYDGRRVDLLMRALRVQIDADPLQAIQAWLEAGARTHRRQPPSAWWLAQKGVVLIAPARLAGKIVWRRENGLRLSG